MAQKICGSYVTTLRSNSLFSNYQTILTQNAQNAYICRKARLRNSAGDGNADRIRVVAECAGWPATFTPEHPQNYSTFRVDNITLGIRTRTDGAYYQDRYRAQ